MITETQYRETIEKAAVAAETGDWDQYRTCGEFYVDKSGND